MTTKQLDLILRRITHSGDSIGRELDFSFAVGLVDANAGTTAVPAGVTTRRVSARLANDESRQFGTTLLTVFFNGGPPRDIVIETSITERDPATDDVATATMTLRPDYSGPDRQQFQLTADVSESPVRGRQKTARFDFDVEVQMAAIAGQGQAALQLPGRDPAIGVVAVCTDVLMGGDDLTDRFDTDSEDAFVRMIDDLDQLGAPVTLVIGGLLDLLGTRPSADPSATDATMRGIAYNKIRRIVRRHQRAVDRLRQLTRKARNRLIVIPGDADRELTDPEVQGRLAALTGIAVEVQPLYHNDDLHVAVRRVGVETFDLESSREIKAAIASTFAESLDIIAKLNRPRPVHYDTFQPRDRYADYLEGLRRRAPLSKLVSESDAEAIAAAIEQMPTPAEVDPLSQVRLADFVRAMTFVDPLEDIGNLANLDSLIAPSVRPRDAVPALVESRASHGITKCLIATSSVAPAIVPIPGQAVLVRPGTWIPRFGLDAQDPANAIPLDSGNVVIAFRTSQGNGVTSGAALQLVTYPTRTTIGRTCYDR